VMLAADLLTPRLAHFSAFLRSCPVHARNIHALPAARNRANRVIYTFGWKPRSNQTSPTTPVGLRIRRSTS
jgi:hypothetical protein